MITALQNGNPIARGVVRNGVANLHLLGDGSVYDKSMPLDFSAVAEDGQSVKLAHRVHTTLTKVGENAQLGSQGFGLLLPAVAFNEPVALVHQQVISLTALLPNGLQFLGGFELGAFKGDGSVLPAVQSNWIATIDLNSLPPSAESVSAAGDGQVPHQCMVLDEATQEWKAIESSLTGSTLTCSANTFGEFAIVSGAGAPPSIPVFLPLVNN